jgi:hypothetical protein
MLLTDRYLLLMDIFCPYFPFVFVLILYYPFSLYLSTFILFFLTIFAVSLSLFDNFLQMTSADIFSNV